MEWEYLSAQLKAGDLSYEGFQNQFFRRLLLVLSDAGAGVADTLMAYRDALLASPRPEDARLILLTDSSEAYRAAEKFGLKVDHRSRVSVLPEALAESEEFASIYKLKQRRFLAEAPMDPALQTRLRNPDFSRYNGFGQQLAVRLALTAGRGSTILLNLPTGCGKTLAAQALALYSNPSDLTLVIVPTVGLAIEQGNRVREVLKKAGLDHGGCYFWHGQQPKAAHDDLKARIKEQNQRILFCSPEAACRSLLPTLFQCAKAGLLSNVVIDEAHVVDHWGADFRPYFQILAGVLRTLRAESPVGIKCLLMSATFTEKSQRLVTELFTVAGQESIRINGAFLRPEIRYRVECVSPLKHTNRVMHAALSLPKPLIIYTLTPNDAKTIYGGLRDLGVKRIAEFTGKTPAGQREQILEEWRADQLDIIVGTSAFGLGMDKNNVRSVLHAAVPENLDRFYQEVGRGGRDGRASQSVVIYTLEQFDLARQLNTQRLITVELGFQKWHDMWKNGEEIANGRRRVSVDTIRRDQTQRTDGNEEWNWRTLLLMQRAGLIRIEMEEPKPPLVGDEIAEAEYREALRRYYEAYGRSVVITPIRDDHLSKAAWEAITRKRREFEKHKQDQGFSKLAAWLKSPTEIPLCYLLTDFYTIDNSIPEYACGGCPACLKEYREIHTPTVGTSALTNFDPPKVWSARLTGRDRHIYVYFPRSANTVKRLLRGWIHWIARMVDLGEIQSIAADASVLTVLQSELSNITNAFWVGEAFDRVSTLSPYWPQLVLCLSSHDALQPMGWPESCKVVVAPDDLKDEQNPYRQWWQSVDGSVSLNNFLSSL